ncbi:hypothetical protein MSAN_01652700 [Mycena sanguinolenta]|uniref:Uncharacterized protein n=1 Tax=Mycena sanguinolenta TaxID=230812 RepID=A0A8H7CWT5_9AGAR|nr:hypothetical protein MSAN_01652700 [Mycena sanguinolenta]
MTEHLLVILAYSNPGEHLRVNWKHAAESLGQFTGSVNSIVYRTADNSEPCVHGVFCVFDSQTKPPECSEIERLLRPSVGQQLDTRIYEAFPSGTPILVPNLPGKHYMVLNGMTPNDAAEQTFNAWYTEEHIPMLSVVPGWRSSVRFRLVTASKNPPRYLALHEWASCDAFQTAQFKAATNTPWRTRVVVEQVIQRERHLLEYQGTVEELKRMDDD